MFVNEKSKNKNKPPEIRGLVASAASAVLRAVRVGESSAGAGVAISWGPAPPEPGAAMVGTVDDLAVWLTEILVCPESKQPLVYFEAEGFLFCLASGLRYRIEDDVPVLLVDEAERLSGAEAESLRELAKERGLMPEPAPERGDVEP